MSSGQWPAVRKTARTYTTVGDLIEMLQRCDPGKLVQLNGHPLYDNPIHTGPPHQGYGGIRGLSINITDERDGKHDDCHCGECEACLGTLEVKE